MTAQPSDRLISADRVPPARAIALALSVAADRGGRATHYAENGPEVRTVLLALELAGWALVGKEAKR